MLRPPSLWLAAALAACGGADGTTTGDAAGPAVRDSAGVRVVDNGASTAAGGRALSDAPLWILGWADGDPAFVDPEAGLIRDDGSVVVGDRRAAVLHFVGPDGAVARTAGRQGDGPGEYRSVTRILDWAGDSLLVFDDALARATLLDREGGHGRSFRVETGRGSRPAAVTSGGALLLVPVGYVPTLGEHTGWVWHDGSAVLYDPDTSAADTLATLPFIRLRYEASSVSSGPFTHFGFFVGREDGWTWAVNDRREVRWYGFDGTLRTVARWDEEAAEVTGDVRQAYIDRNEDWARENGRDVEQVRRSAEEQLATHEGPLPWFSRLVVGRDGETWLGRYVAGNEPPTRYRVFARDGVRLRDVEVSPRFTVLDIRGDLVLGVLTDDLDVPAVALYRLIPTPGS